MIFSETPVQGAYLIAPERREDSRGFFARVWCSDEFAARGLETGYVQANVGYSIRAGTVRGMHFQIAPHEEVKLVRCLTGALYDVVLDLRPDSPTYLRWYGVELTGDNLLALYIPAGCAHGYQTLQDGTTLMYHTSCAYAAHAARGVRYNDPVFGIEWPLPVSVISDADATWPDYQPLSRQGAEDGYR